MARCPSCEIELRWGRPTERPPKDVVFHGYFAPADGDPIRCRCGTFLRFAAGDEPALFVEAPARNGFFAPHPALGDRAHRPWPLANTRWSVAMRWHDLLFAHWPLDADVDALRAAVPAGMELDFWEDRPWIGVIPFRMTNVRNRGAPPMPGHGAFPEINVRTYVTVDRKPGVYFLSLDAASRLAVRAARWSFSLPYYEASITCRREGANIAYRSVRTHRGAKSAAFSGRYGPTGPARAAEPGTFEHWVAERYCLYSVDAAGRVLRGDIHHAKWPLQPAWAEIEEDTLSAAAGIALPEEAPHLLFSRFVDAVAWPPVRVR